MKNLMDYIIKRNIYEYVSFDIFDTLILRVVNNPVDIFKLVQKKGLELYGNYAIKEFMEIRVVCERNLRENCTSEITLDDIYAEMKKNTNSELIEEYKQIEIECELNCTICNKNIKELYDHLLQEKIPIIITSDMYLPKDIIERILLKEGYKGYHKLYLSSDVHCRKRSGELFRYIVNDLNIYPDKILHIGDSIMSDYIMARKSGLHSSLYYMVNLFLETKKGKKTIWKISNNYKSDDFVNEIGYKKFGPFLYGYIRWLHSNIIEKKYKKIYFLSRDGYFMKESYDSLYPSNKTEYLYMSRRLLQVAALWLNPDIEDVLSNMYIPKRFDLKWFIQMLGLNCESILDQINNCSLSVDSLFDRKKVQSNREFIRFYNCIKDRLIENSKKEYESLERQLKEISFSGNIAIVDIGWIGNMQNLLSVMCKQMNIDVEIDGYYIGVNPFSKNQENNKMYGYLFNKNKNENLYFKERFIDNIFELFFSAPHGSAQRYYINSDNKVRIALGDFEYKNSETYVIFRKMQKKALAFAEQFRLKDEYIYLGDEELYEEFIECFSNPTNEICTFLSEINYYDSAWKKLVPQNSIFFYFIHPLCFLKDFANCPWKPGFLKKYFKIIYKGGDFLAFMYRKAVGNK